MTIRRASAPAEVVGQWKFGDERAEGDETAWTLAPHVFVGYDPTLKDYVTILIDPTDRTVNVQPVEWFDETYHWGYQQPAAEFDLGMALR